MCFDIKVSSAHRFSGHEIMTLWSTVLERYVLFSYYSADKCYPVLLLTGSIFWLQLFENVEVFKPMASRSTSAETYLLGLNYKAPDKINPNLLDYRQLFKVVAEPTKKVGRSLCLMVFLSVFSGTLPFTLKFLCL